MPSMCQPAPPGARDQIAPRITERFQELARNRGAILQGQDRPDRPDRERRAGPRPEAASGVAVPGSSWAFLACVRAMFRISLPPYGCDPVNSAGNSAACRRATGPGVTPPAGALTAPDALQTVRFAGVFGTNSAPPKTGSLGGLVRFDPPLVQCPRATGPSLPQRPAPAGPGVTNP